MSLHNPFQKAVKHEAYLRMAIAGPSGSGKTYTSLNLATALAEGRPIALLDTEHGSAEKYADIFRFDTISLRPPFHPDRFVEHIEAAADYEYDFLILDSLSHAWNGAGGLLEIVDHIAARLKTSNTFVAWKDATPIQNRLVEAIVGAPLHVIATMRSKQEYVIDQVEKNGRIISIPRKVGMAPIQRDSFEYEFDVFMEMDIDNNAIVAKSRCPNIAGELFPKPGGELASELRRWLRGEPATPKDEIYPTGALIYLNGTVVDPTNQREVKAYCSYLDTQGVTPPSRSLLKRWVNTNEVPLSDTKSIAIDVAVDAAADLVSQKADEVSTGSMDSKSIVDDGDEEE